MKRARSFLASFATCLLFTTTLSAQSWKPFSGPTGGAFDELGVSSVNPSIIVTHVSNAPLPLYSTNAGVTWQPFELPPGYGTWYDIRIVPGTQQTISMLFGGSLYTSTNFGTSWTKQLTLPTSSPYTKVRQHPTISTMWFAWGNIVPVLRSTDNGLHWDTVIAARSTSVPISNVLMSFVDARQMWTTLRDTMYESIDTGHTWQRVNYTPILGYSISLKCADRTIADRLYAYFQGRIGVSTDKGRTWTDRTGQNVLGSTGIEQDPTDPNIMWSWGTNVLRSTDRGESWIAVDTMNPTRMKAQLVQGQLTVACYEGGILRGNAAGTSWQRLDRNISQLQIRRIHALSQTRFFVEGINDVIETTDGGSTWSWLTPVKYDQPSGGRVYSFDVSASDPAHMIGGTNSDIYRSTDGGRTWLTANPHQNNPMYCASISATNPMDVIMGGMWSIRKSTDGGVTWKSPTGMSFGSVKEILRSVSDPSNILASDGSILYVSTDNGTTWSTPTLSIGMPANMISDPTAAHRFYGCGKYTGVVTTTDGGMSWTTTWPLDERISAIVLDPTNSDLLYGTTSNGSLLRFHRSTQRTDTVYLATYVNAMPTPTAMHMNGSTIIMGTERGLYWFDPTPTSVVNGTTSGAVQVYPNPAHDELHVVIPNDVDLAGEALDVTFMDCTGRILQTQTATVGAAVSTASLPCGLYGVRIRCGEHVWTTMIVRM